MASSAAANISDPLILAWAEGTSTPSCDAACRLSSASGGGRGTWWEDLELASFQVCWGCDQAPWPHEQQYARKVWRSLHEERVPIRSVSKRCNVWSVPCPRGLELRSSSSRCLVGHFVYAVLCFFRWMGEGQEPYALLNLESAMDLAWVVGQAPCGDRWGFTVPEVAANYERLLTTVWHLHGKVTEYWLPAPGPLLCQRPRPVEPQERPLGHGIRLPLLRVQCLVLAVFPAEQERMGAIADTYASSCSSLFFLTASDAPDKFRDYAVVDLRRYFHMQTDVQWAPPGSEAPGQRGQARDANTIDKTIRAFHWAALLQRGASESQKADVICRLDSDTLFFPQNLQRVLACRNFSTHESWALGHANYAHKHQQPGRAFLSGGTGICLSRGALDHLLVKINAGEVKWSASPGDWNTGGCVSAPGHWDDVVFGACMAQFGVPLSRWDTDCLGRSLFWPHQLESALAGPGQIQPLRLPPKATFFHPPGEGTAETDPSIMNYYHWRYRAWQHLACSPPVWLSDFPIGLHPYRNTSQARKGFALVRDGRTLRGYTPQLWDGSSAQCEDLAC